MSWCRWGSPCDFTFPIGVYQADLDCVANGCPGSDLYIYTCEGGKTVCCGCRLMPDGRDFTAQTHDEMTDHIEHHVLAGHHVRQSLRRGEQFGKVSEAYKGSVFDPDTDPGITTPSGNHDE